MRPYSSLAVILCGLAATSLTARAEHRQSASPQEIALARSTCSDVMRIRPGFVPFDACVESLAQTLDANAGRMAPRATATSNAMARPAETSYSESNPTERRRKEEYACAQLGIEAGSFSQCIADLDSALRSMEYSN